jgi:GPH family glycoside/pentoside/hexuronide:cation symporter
MNGKVKLRTKLGYGASDMASTMVWGTINAYLLIFYTDVFGIAAAAAGTLFLFARLWDAVNDPIMGIIIDKTNTRFGKCRPYFLWMALPLGVSLVLTFTTPALDTVGKIVYASITYIFLGMIYTAINIPVTAILPRITDLPGERVRLGVFRTVGMMAATLFINVATLPLVKTLGKGNVAAGYQTTMTVYAVVAVLLFLLTFFTVKEKVQVSTKKIAISEGLKALKGNRPWIVVFFLGVMMQMGTAMRTAGAIYYLKYNMGREDLVPIMGLLTLIILPALLLSPMVISKIGKTKTVIMGAAIASAGFLLVALLGERSLSMLFLGNGISLFGMGFTISLIFVMISDTVDYGEWKSGVNAAGLLSASASFGQKLGTSLGGALSGWILALGRYAAVHTAQPPSALLAIKFIYVIIPLLACISMIVLMLFYKMDAVHPQMTRELAERRELCGTGSSES